jgi:hypothetical protein
MIVNITITYGKIITRTKNTPAYLTGTLVLKKNVLYDHILNKDFNLEKKLLTKNYNLIINNFIKVYTIKLNTAIIYGFSQ